MHCYDCDLDVIKTSFTSYSESRFHADIAKEISSITGKFELFDRARILLENSMQDQHVIFTETAMISNICLEQIDRPIHMFYKFSDQLEIAQNTENKSVDMAFVLVSPESDGAIHLRRLSRLSRLMQDQGFYERLRQVEDKDIIRLQFMFPEVEEKAA